MHPDKAASIAVKVNALDGATGQSIAFTELRSLAVRCGPTQHDYRQGSSFQGDESLERLLYCANCGDVITFALPREEGQD